MKTLFYALLLALLPACSVNYGLVAAQLDDSHGPNHVYAFYGDDNRLLNDPVRTVRELAGKSKPFTDIYVVSHGWNFTLPEAIEQYQDYLHQFDEVRKELDACKEAPDFNPLFVMVGWTSVTRPLTTTASSILPFGLDRAIRLPTSFLDMLLFHVPSTWKQSLNAATNALGRSYPDEYLGARTTKQNARQEGVYQDLRLIRRDFPLSAVIYELMRLRHEDKLTCSDGTATKPKIHCVGHSFGAKLVSLATMEALRRFEWASGETGPGIESLVLFNAAMHASEFYYNPSGFDTPLLPSCPAPLLQRIPRKVCVYSNYDYATGFLFELSQIPLNNFHSHVAQRWIDSTIDEIPDSFFGDLFRAPALVVGGVVQLGFSSVFGAGMWGVRKVVNVPQDLWHHVTEYEGTKDWWGVFRYPFNLVHYFLPLNEIIGGRADQRGIFRHSTSALGRTGLYRHAAGRPFEAVIWDNYPSFGNTAPITDFATSGELSPKVYSEMAARVPLPSDEIPYADGCGAFTDGNQFYSLDASAALNNGWMPFIGSHGDLRSHSKVELETGAGKVETKKVHATIRFLFNWTKARRKDLLAN